MQIPQYTVKIKEACGHHGDDVFPSGSTSLLLLLKKDPLQFQIIKVAPGNLTQKSPRMTLKFKVQHRGILQRKATT